MDMDHVKGSNVCDQAIGGMGNYQGIGKSSQMDSENKKTAVHAEMARVNKLPSNSSYATHRMKVLNKILHLLSIPVSKLAYQALKFYTDSSLWFFYVAIMQALLVSLALMLVDILTVDKLVGQTSLAKNLIVSAINENEEIATEVLPFFPHKIVG